MEQYIVAFVTGLTTANRLPDSHSFLAPPTSQAFCFIYCP
jgi:hypothetical protein